MLEGFLRKAKDDESQLDLKELMTADESLQWEILVKAMENGWPQPNIIALEQKDRFKELLELLNKKVD